jgi:NADH:ubiquinone oxidoreductase subunit 6 (subunit J)
VLAALALLAGAVILVRTEAAAVETFLFYAFSGLAIGAGVMMISQANPVHAALSFALVVLSTCGLFLLQAAPFLMAATIIIYAGAIVVTFLFVIMLAQQEGVSNADQRSREPALACLAGGVLLASLVCVLHKTYQMPDDAGVRTRLRDVAAAADAAEVKRLLGDYTHLKDDVPQSEFIEQLKKQYPDDNTTELINNLHQSWRGMRLQPAKNLQPAKERAGKLLAAIETRRNQQGSVALAKVPGKDKTPGHFLPGKLPASNVAAIGRTLFTDYLIPVLLAATLLLVATIGAIAIAGRRGGSEELR